MRIEGELNIPGVIRPNLKLCRKFCLKPNQIGIKSPVIYCIESMTLKKGINLIKIEDLLTVPKTCPYYLEKILLYEPQSRNM